MNKKHWVILILVTTIAFIIGVYIGNYKTAVFWSVYKLVSAKSVKNSVSSIRDIDLSFRTEAKVDTAFRTGVFVTYGQSNASNAGQFGYSVKNKVYQYYDDKTYKYEDPALGGTDGQGSVWGQVGDKMIDKGLFDQVVFSVTGVGGKPLEELNKGECYEYFKHEYLHMSKTFGKVDAILFHQGESNNCAIGNDKIYKAEFEKFITKMRQDGITAPIYLARSSYFDGKYDSIVIRVQNEMIRDNKNVLKGPNSDLLTNKKLRLPDDLHFSMAGFDSLSTLWVEAMIAK